MINKLATEALSYFNWQTRADGSGFWSIGGVIEDKKHQWVLDMCRNAHNGMLPDDHKYEFIRDALMDISGLDDDDGEDEARDIEVEADIYAADLLKWLSSNLGRSEYCDEAQRDALLPTDASLMERVTFGQYMERREVLNLVIDALVSRAEELGNE
jgi:hypothetical protein